MSLPIGSKAPDFFLPSTNGKKFSLSEDWRNRPGIVFFYPKDFTGGCTKEVCDFRDQFEAFRNLEIDVVGISLDDIPSHIQFKSAHRLPFELLSDVDGKVAKQYDAKVPFIQMTKRITYFLDKNHIIRAAYEEFFNGEKHVGEILRLIRKITT